MHIIAGLGNPGEEYALTRHNAGRMAVEYFRKSQKFDDWIFDKKINALKTEGKIKKEKVLLLVPETYMNKSGLSLKKIITSKKKAEGLIVVHDDIDLPLGRFKISFGKSSAGHKGVESVIRTIKTKDFIRVRIGSRPKQKPQGKKMLDFLTGKFKPRELQIIKRLDKKIALALETIITKGLPKAMSEYN
jgi:PTH1 family peptidyl-tRNA hydrolase